MIRCTLDTTEAGSSELTGAALLESGLNLASLGLQAPQLGLITAFQMVLTRVQALKHRVRLASCHLDVLMFPRDKGKENMFGMCKCLFRILFSWEGISKS